MRLQTLTFTLVLLLSSLAFPIPGQTQDAAAAGLLRWKDIREMHPRPAQDPFQAWMNQTAQRQLQERAERLNSIRTVAGAKERQRWVHAKLLEIMGGLPDYHGPLNVQKRGQIKARGYTIEKIIYESLPGFYVTANVYRPNTPGRHPAVLLQSGHIQEGKPEDQRVAANLALKGFVVLTFDPIGQGEREQSYDRELDGSVAGWGTMEHMQAGAQSFLIGEGVARYFIWDGIRSVDYLASRADVDPDRIGAAGCSGGGALTTYVGALDPRIKAVASACSTNSYQLEFARPVPNGEFHAEMSLPRFLASGLDSADFAESAAPKPWLILATEKDFFTPDAAKLVYDEAKHWYGIWGAEDKVHFFVGPGPHGMPLPTRELIYEWMTRWLKDGQGDTREEPVHLYTNIELLVTPTGHVDDLPGSRKLFQIIRDDYRKMRKPEGIPELQAELSKLGIPSTGTPPEVKLVDESEREGFRRQQIRFESQPGVEIGGQILIPTSPEGRKPAVLLLASPASLPLAEKIARQGKVALIVEPRDSPWGNDYRPFIGNWVANTQADLIGLNLPAMRAHDLIRGVDLLTARGDVDAASIRAAATGPKGIWLLLAAAADPRIGKIWLDHTPVNYRSALDKSLDIELLETAIPGFVLHWDLEDLVKAMGSRPVMRTDPTNWVGRVVPAGPQFEYRYALGDATDMATAQDDAYLEEFLKK